jgi:guanosine-3',5'-bis(diphosphate) 3'-pyrophosphohydrolase
MSAMIVRAAELARYLHQGQVQADGTSYFDGHLLAVADILFDAGASQEMIAAGLLHAAVTRGTATLQEIEREFGSEVADMVKALADGWSGYLGAPDPAPSAAPELERLAEQSPEVQTIKLADDLVRLRQANLVSEQEREVLLAEVTARLEQLLQADLQVRYQVHAALARWTDSGETLVRALALMHLSAGSTRH